MPKFKLGRLTSSQILSAGYVSVILLGALLLMLPFSTYEGHRVNFIDALFTSTSATCVTGLTVVTVKTTYTVIGQLIILLLIQIGGLGVMTISTAFAIFTGRKITLRQRLLIQEDLKQFEISGLLRLIQYILTVTFTIEGVGALILFTRLARDYPLAKAAYYSIFHAVSAFNNAGFDLFGNSIEGYVGDFTINVTIMLLIIIGGLGFAVLAEFYDKRKITSLHAKMVVTTTAILLVVGWASFYALEHSNPNSMAHMNLGEKLLASLFLSVSPRTAGFDSIPCANLYPATLFLVILLMFIGASPGSTGGGIKTTTFSTIMVHLWSTVRGKEDVEVFGRRLEEDVVVKAFTTFSAAVILVFIIAFILSMTEKLPFLNLLFETVSAFGTVGLTAGVTPHLSDVGRVLITLTMLCGRVGTLTLIMSMSERRTKAQFHYPKERIMVG